MNYKIEELVPIVGKLAEHYTAGQSSSIKYEAAEQLMEAVLYAIHEAETFDSQSLVAAQIPAEKMYTIGVACIEEKVKKSLELYNQILPKLDFFENEHLYDIFLNELPEFFKWYDIKFDPQDTIILLYYPALRHLDDYSGIDKIYEFLKSIYMELYAGV